MRRLAPALVLGLLLIGAAVDIGIVTGPRLAGYLSLQRGTTEFFDFRIFNATVVDRLEGKPLYATEDPHFFEPGSATYKYPPPYAALLSFHADRRWIPVAHRFLVYEFAALLLAFGILAAGAHLDPGGRRHGRTGGRPATFDPTGPTMRSLGALALLVLWKPIGESLSGLQLESLFLPFFALALVGLGRGWSWLEGVAIGVSAACKVYPTFLALGLLATRRWRDLAIGSTAGLIVLVLGSLRFSWGETLGYFTSVLPRLGGTNVTRENLSAFGQIGRIFHSVDVTGAIPYPTLEALGSPLEIWTTRLLAFLIVGALVIVTARTTARLHGREASAWRFAASLPILLVSLPTSWLDYQALLYVPAAWLFLRLPWERRHLGAWIALASAVLPFLLLDAGSPAFRTEIPLWLVSIRAIAPLALWGTLMMAARTTATSTAAVRTDAPAPVSHPVPQASAIRR